MEHAGLNRCRHTFRHGRFLTRPPACSRFPLQLLSPPANSFLNSSFPHLKSFLKSERQPFIELNPETRLAVGLRMGVGPSLE